MNMPTIEAAPDCLSADARLPHRRGSYLPLLGIVVFAFILRLFCVVFLTGTIDTEGAEYARIAENLVSDPGIAESPHRVRNSCSRRCSRS